MLLTYVGRRQPCNFIVRFDLYQRHISIIQSKGRARAPGSHYLLFCEKGASALAPSSSIAFPYS